MGDAATFNLLYAAAGKCELLHFAFSGRSIQQAEGRRITQMNDFLEPRISGGQRIRNHLGRSALPRYQRSPYRLALGGRCQKAPTHQRGLPYSECSAYIKLRREPTSGLEPPTCSSYERAGRHLYATERLSSLTASSSSPTNWLLFIDPRRRYMKTYGAIPPLLWHAPVPSAELHPESGHLYQLSAFPSLISHLCEGRLTLGAAYRILEVLFAGYR